jgi:RNA polymerase sigma-70 factor (ECF subfamily)
MEQYADGDIVAFDELYELLRPVLLASLRRWLVQDHKVSDAFQVTWLKLHVSRARYQRGAPVLPWILAIARNVALDHLRSKAAKERPLDEEAATALADESAEFAWTRDDEQEVIDAVRQGVTQLPPIARDVIRLHKLEERPMAEVAEILGIREGAARVRAHRGYKALARLLLGLKLYPMKKEDD